MQISLFGGTEKFVIDKPIRLIELFAGYGSQHFAVEYLGVKFESWKICEWAVKSIQAYKDAHFKNDKIDYSKGLSHYQIVQWLLNKGISANYNEPMKEKQIIHLGETKARQIYNNIKATHNLVNIQQTHAEDLEIVDTDKYCYVMTYSFPCQDLSLAGKQKGMEKGSGTRSGMLWEVERILDECTELPQVLLMENVPEVIGSKNIKHFAKWLEKLESLGYHCYWEVLNGKNYGVPQNRERCFMVSVLGDYYYEFPQKIKLEHKLEDLLEDEVDEKYYLSDKQIEDIKKWNAYQKPLETMERVEKSGISPTLTTRSGEYAASMVLIKEYIGTYQYAKSDNFMQGKSRFAPNKEVSDTLQTTQKEGVVELKRQLCNKLIQDGLVEEGDVIRHSYTNNRLDNGIKNMSRTESKDKLCPTLDTRCDCLGVVVDYRIRKFTPKECFRLMGIKDKDFEQIAENQSNASLYHLAGDSIIVDVLMAIFKEML